MSYILPRDRSLTTPIIRDSSAVRMLFAVLRISHDEREAEQREADHDLEEREAALLHF